MYEVNQNTLWKSNLEYLAHKESLLDDPIELIGSNVAPISELIRSAKRHTDETRRIILSPKQTKTLASLMPNLVLETRDLLGQKMNHLFAVLLRIDISGFTKLSETCVLHGGEDGIFKLTNILNNYFGRMSDEIFENGGDVWKFAGDSLLSLWKVEGKDILSHVIYRAVRCGLLIQKKLGCYDTGFNVVLRLKVGLAVGNMIWSMIGDDFARRHIIVGGPVNEVRDADHYASSGDVIASASIWGHMCPLDFVHQVIEGGRYVKIFNMVSYLGISTPKELRAVGAPGYESKSAEDRQFQGRVFPDFSEKDNLGAILRLCLLDPVVQQVDADLSLDFLTEMRVLTIMFIHIIPYNLLNTELVVLVDKAYNIIQGLVRSAGGYVDKACLFDKDIMFVCFFGLRGLYQTDEVAQYLCCGHCVREACRSINGIIEISLGVTTSNIFCGVIGNKKYQNYTVIGPAANLAARLMCAYPGQVTCDGATKRNSQLPATWFQICPERTMRNISGKVVAYEFIGTRSRRLQFSMDVGILPLLGRSVEVQEFEAILDSSEDLPGAILIEGDIAAGKSRLVNEFILMCCQRGRIPVNLILYESHGQFQLFSAIHILTQALNLGSGKQRENMLVELLKNELDAEDLKQIPVLCSRCPHQFDAGASPALKRIFVTALKKGLKYEILVIDDADFCDLASWELLMAAVEARVKFMLLTTKSNRLVPERTKSHMKIWKLKPLNSELLAAVACQTLAASAIHNKVLKFLLKTTQGNPGKCAATLKTLLDLHFIEIHQLEENRTMSKNIATVPSEYLERKIYPWQLKTAPITWIAPNFPVTVEEVTHDFAHQNFLATMKILRQMESGAPDHEEDEVPKVKVVQSDSILADDTFKIMSAETFHMKIDDIATGGLRPSSEYTDTIIDIFGARKNIKMEPGRPAPYVAFEKTYDEIYIEEAMHEFIMDKERQGRSLAPRGDIRMDNLRKHRRDTCVTEISEGSTMASETTTAPDEDSIFELDDDSEDGSTSMPSLTDTQKQRRASVWSTLSSKGSKRTRANTSTSARRGPGSGNYIPTIVVRLGVNLEMDATKPDSSQEMLSFFDSLRPFEQLLLKCCSVIGSKFSRAMVDELLHHPDPIFTSVAVKNLFEVNILRCSQLGILDKDALCSCRNFKRVMTQGDEKLPGYAFCQNLAFRSTKFREALYNLLPPNQKRLFHERAVEFLLTQSNLCPTCQGIDRVSSGVRKSTAGNVHFPVTTVPGRAEDIALLLDKTFTVEMPDWTACSCMCIRGQILDQIINHAQSAGLTEIKLEYRVLKAEHMVALGRHTEARKLLKTNLNHCRSSSVGKAAAYIIARMEMCSAEMDLYDQDFSEAYRNVNSAISKIRTFWWENCPRETFKSSVWNKLLMKGDFNKTGPLMVRALNMLAYIRLVRFDYVEAQSLCLDMMSLAEHANVCEMDMAKCYGIYMDASMGRNKLVFDKDVEKMLVEKAARILELPSVESGLAALRIIYVIANIRAVCMTNLLDALHLMLAVKRLAHNLPVRDGLNSANLDLVVIMVARVKLRKAAELIVSLNGMVDDITYHALCLNFFRTTGFWVEEPRNCLTFLKDALGRSSLEDTRSNREGLVSLWLWYLYTNPAYASEWEKRIVLHTHPELPITISTLFLMGQETWALLLQIHYSTSRSPLKVRLLTKRLAKLKQLSNHFHYLTPWLYYLKAHYTMWLTNNPSSALAFLERAAKAATENGCKFLMIRIEFVRESWLRGVQPKPFCAADGGEWTKLEHVERSAIYTGRH